MAERCPICGKNLEDGYCPSCERSAEGQKRVSNEYSFTTEMLAVYGKEQKEALKKILEAEDPGAREKVVGKVVEKIVAKIQYPTPVPEDDFLLFLECFYHALSGKPQPKREKPQEIPPREKPQEKAQEKKSALSSSPKKETKGIEEGGILPLLKEHVVFLLLALGVGFLFTGAMLFFRSHWEEYKYLVFWIFLALTLLCFGSGYLVFRSKKNLSSTISLTLLLIACLFFPINFYIAVKAGILQDHGNRYILLWITFLLFVYHSYLLRSTTFTCVGMFIFTWAYFQTLWKFLPHAYAQYPVYCALHAFIFCAIAIFLKKGKEEIKSYCVLGYTQLLLAYAAFQAFSFWDTSLFTGMMSFVVLVALAQLHEFEKTYFGKIASYLFPFSILVWVFFLFKSLGCSGLWPGVPASLALFLLAYGGKNWTRNIHKDTLHHCGIGLPLGIYASFFWLGSYEYAHNDWALLLSAFLFSAFYGYWSLQGKRLAYLSIFFSFLAIHSLLEFFPGLGHLSLPLFFMLWSLALCGASFARWAREKEWIRDPLRKSCEIAVMVVLAFFLLFGNNYYHERFGLLSLGMMVASAYYSLLGIYLKNNRMTTMGATLMGAVIVLFTYRLEMGWYTISIVMIVFALLLAFLEKCLQKKIERSTKPIEIFSIAIVFISSAVSFYSGVNEHLWQVKAIVALALFFSIARYRMQRSLLGMGTVLLYVTALYYLVWEGCSLYRLPCILMPLAVVAILLFYASRTAPQDDVAAVVIRKIGYPSLFKAYAYLLLLFSCVMLLLFFRLYYHELDAEGIRLTLYLAIACVFLYRIEQKALFLYGLFVFLYLHYFLWLPRDLFPFTYALFFLPLGCAFLGWSFYQKGSPLDMPLFRMAQITVNAFLLLPFIFPGIVPSAAVSFFILLWVFFFYFLCVHFYRKLRYVYITASFFLLTSLVGLFALKLWGREITLVMSLLNLLLLSAGILSFYRKEARFGVAVLEVALLHLLGVLISILIQGKVDDPTLLVLLSCGVQFMFMACLRKRWPSIFEEARFPLFRKISESTLSFTSIFLFAIGYYLWLARMDLEYPSHVYQYFSLSAVSLCMALLVRKLPYIRRPFLAVSLIAPVISIIHTTDTGTLASLLFLSSVVYLVMSSWLRSSWIASLGWAYLVLAPYSLLMRMNSEYWVLGIYSIAGGGVLVAISCWLSKKMPRWEFLFEPLWKTALANQFIFVGLVFWDTHHFIDEHVYFTVAASLLNGLFLFAVSSIKGKPWGVAIFFSLFSYYVLVYSWAFTVWEFYTVPPGLLLLGIGVYLESRYKGTKVHQELYLLGLLLILVPSLIQSHKGWYAHTNYPGGEPYQNLYHSIFLSLESLFLLLFGMYKKRTVFFFTGFVFLTADALLMLLCYVHFGNIPQAIWWATLGVLLILSAWFLEYERKKGGLIGAMISEKRKKLMDELKSWN